MDDIAIFTAYYSHYQIRAADAAATPSISRKRHGTICVFLALGAACGLSTVVVGFFAHKPAIVWPVVAVGLFGVIIGVVLAHRKATGDWLWRSPTASDPREGMQSGNNPQGGPGTAPAGFAMGGGGGGRFGALFHLPMYYADALDVEVGIVQPPYPLMLSLSSEKVEGGRKTGGAEVCGGGDGTDAAHDVKAKAASKGAEAMVAAEFGAVVCGFPLPGADGWIDTRPVLVLQPQVELQLQPLSMQYDASAVRALGEGDGNSSAETILEAVEGSSVLQLPADVQQSKAVASVEAVASEVAVTVAQGDVLAASNGLGPLRDPVRTAHEH
ncbi:hypothetical protein Vretimale_71 [Volvox reticuliferus]|uniref:Transmembrane protein n=1 Tax=Volvox reticuliferus TaxID=1737510 RepID=A0A8J4G0M2_9CHLO|nr:hypothetical protein Vretifemale_8431 [Volvox reticuliferus]GIL93767.1 hypothetical protein Vretimale_71 [Volvox reticuliferus]